jgi:hypothetical protein
MSSNHDANETAFYFDFNHQEHKKEFTNLQTCDDADDSRKYIQLQIFL